MTDRCRKCGGNNVSTKRVKKAGHVGTHIECNVCTGKHGGKTSRFVPGVPEDATEA